MEFSIQTTKRNIVKVRFILIRTRNKEEEDIKLYLKKKKREESPKKKKVDRQNTRFPAGIREYSDRFSKLEDSAKHPISLESIKQHF